MEINKITTRFDHVAKNYDEQRRNFIPCFDDFYHTSISFLTQYRKNFQNILDLGAGTGLLTSFLYDHFPSSTYTLQDVSSQMLDIAKKRFSGSKNFHYSCEDYSLSLPGESFDLIASALSIHHLEEKSKAALYNNIYAHLNEGGVFINLDQFNADSELMNTLYDEYWYHHIETHITDKKVCADWSSRRELDKENTVQETIFMLQQSGFKTIECIYRYFKFAVIMAIKE